MNRLLILCLFPLAVYAADLSSAQMEMSGIAAATPEAVQSGRLILGQEAGQPARLLLRPRFPGAPPLASAAAGELRLHLAGAAGTWKSTRIELRVMPAAEAAWSAASATWTWQHLSGVRHVKTGAWEHHAWPGGPGAAGTLGTAALASAEAGRDGDVLLFISDSAVLVALAGRGAGALLVTAPGLEHDGGAVTVKSATMVLRQTQTVRPVVNIPVEVPTACDRLSLLILGANGRPVRELLHAVPAPPGTHSIAWDGLDDAGKELPAGAYTWKALTSAGLRAEYLLTLGLSVDHQNLWPGNHIGVSGLAVDPARDRVYLGSGCSEAYGFALAMDQQGQRIWTNPEFWFDAWKGPDAMAVDGDDIFFAQLDGDVFRLDARTGKRLGNAWKLMPAGKPVRSGTADRGWGAMKNGRMHSGNVAYLDLAAGRGRLAMSFELHDLVRFVHPVKGSVLREVALPAPRGLAFAADGRLLAISDGRIVALGDAGDAVEVVPATSLTDPWRLAIDPQDGSLLVAELGASQQIVRFSAAGKELQRYGRKGGRPAEGAYDGGVGFLGLTTLAAGTNGSIWVAEAYTAPRRIAQFDRGGQLVREWFGPQMYASRCFPDPADHRVVWMDSYWGELIEAEVDYAKRSWTVKGTWRYGDGYNHEDGMWFVRHHSDQTYLCDESGPRVLRVDRAGRRLVPVAEVGAAFYPGGNSGWRIPETFRPGPGQWDEGAAKLRDPKDERSHKSWSFWWHDADDDGRQTAAEAVWSEYLLGFPRTSYVDDQLAYHTTLSLSWKDHGAWCGKELAQGQGVLRVAAWTPGGAPHYELAAASWLPADQQRGANGLWIDRDGNRWGCDKQRLMRWNPDGTLAWTVGRPTAGARPGPGETKSIHRMIGTAHGTCAVAEIHNSDSGVWDRDGLWVGRLLEAPDLSKTTARAYELCGENFGGVIIEEPGRPGAALYYGGTPNAVAVYRITGYADLRRSGGQVSLLPKN